MWGNQGEMHKRLRKILVAYGVFLIAMGLIAFALSGFAEKAKTAIMSGGLSGLIILVCAWALCSRISLVSAAGRYAALLYTVMLVGVFTWRTTAALQEYGTDDWALYKPVVIGTMLVVSILSGGLQVMTLRKPL